jgi:hypothetical protein
MPAAVVRVAFIQADERPVVPAVALGTSPGRDALPGPCRDLLEQGVGALGARAGPDRVNDD